MDTAIPALVQVTADPWDIEPLVEALTSELGAVVRAARGAEMRTRAEAFAELAAALELSAVPESWEALTQALADLVLEPGAVALLVVDAHLVLTEEPARQWERFVAVLSNAALAGREALEPDRACLTQVLLHAPTGEDLALARRIADAGAAPSAA